VKRFDVEQLVQVMSEATRRINLVQFVREYELIKVQLNSLGLMNWFDGKREGDLYVLAEQSF